MNWVGQTLGQYRIEALLDAGSMGQVFRGVHLSLNRSVAIKIMRTNLANNANFQACFLQEARAAAALKHPNIVEIYEFNEQNGYYYLVMELMSDGSLHRLLQGRPTEQPWSLSLGLELIRQAALGLTEAHAHGMVHCDIKPDNLLLHCVNRTRRIGAARQYQLKVGDFGLAKLAARSGLTPLEAPLGTLAYMSPEQCLGENLDGRSDLYSLGVVLYQIATGYLPFEITTFREALQKHVNDAPLPPRQVRSDVPVVVEEIILRCLQKRPEERYATGRELVRALQYALTDAAVGAATRVSLPSSPSQGPAAVQSPYVSRISAQAVSTLPAVTARPRVRVLDRSGETLLVKEVTGEVLTVGRRSNNDIVLRSEVVSRRHLHILWDGKQVSVKDLGSSCGTQLEDVWLPPQVSQVWMPQQVLRIGPFWLHLDAADSAEAQSVPEIPTQTLISGPAEGSQTQVSATMVRSDRIGLAVSSRMLSITPGEPASIQVTLTNLGNTMDWFTIVIEGVPQGWIQESGLELQLKPGVEKSVEIKVHVAREAQNLAQVYPVKIQAYSHRRRGEVVSVQSHWTVLSFTEDVLGIEPRQANGHGSAIYTVTLQNSGNTPTHYMLSVADDERKIDYQLGTDSVTVVPGEEARVPLAVNTRRHWLGRAQRLPFQVYAHTTSNSAPLSVPGEFVNKARLSVWLLPATLVVFIIAVSLVYAFGTLPYRLSTPPPTVGLTATPTLNWTARNSGTDMYLLGVTTSGSQFVAVGNSGTILTSPDAISWATQNSGITNNLQSVIWARSQFVAVGDAGTILTSPEGVNWTRQISPVTRNLNAVAWTESQFVAVGDFGTVLTSSDGVNWTLQNSGTIYKLGGVARNNSLLVAVGGPSGGAQGNAVILTSPLDGTHWTPQQVDTTSFLRRIVWSGTRFVAVGNHGAIFTSTDGINWMRDDVGTVIEHLGDITWSGSEFIVVGDSGRVLTSADGINWTRQSSVTLRYLRKVIWSHPRYIAVGANGTILTSG